MATLAAPKHRRQHRVQNADRLHNRQSAVGDTNFADRFHSDIVTGQTQSWRVVNMCDLVPLLPPKDIFDVFDDTTYFYQHVTNDVLLAFFKGGAIKPQSGELHRGDSANDLSGHQPGSCYTPVPPDAEHGSIACRASPATRLLGMP